MRTCSAACINPPCSSTASADKPAIHIYMYIFTHIYIYIYIYIHIYIYIYICVCVCVCVCVCTCRAACINPPCNSTASADQPAGAPAWHSASSCSPRRVKPGSTHASSSTAERPPRSPPPPRVPAPTGALSVSIPSG